MAIITNVCVLALYRISPPINLYQQILYPSTNTRFSERRFVEIKELLKNYFFTVMVFLSFFYAASLGDCKLEQRTAAICI